MSTKAPRAQMKLGVKPHAAKYCRIDAAVGTDKKRVPLGLIEINGQPAGVFESVTQALFFAQTPMLAHVVLGLLKEAKPGAPTIIGARPVPTQAQSQALRALAMYKTARDALSRDLGLSEEPAIITDREEALSLEQLDQVMADLTGKKAVH